MISIAGVVLPESAVWSNENAYGQPISSIVTDADGYEHIYTSASVSDIDIYIPNVKDGLTRKDAETLMAIAQSAARVAVMINGRAMTARFRYGEDPLDIKPISAKQTYGAHDIYYGTIRLTEV